MRRQRGDTIIEVFFATAIAGAILIAAITLMNRNLATIQMAAETTLVRQNIDSQVEVLRYVKDAYMNNRTATNGLPGIWKAIVSSDPVPGGYLNSSPSNFGTCTPPDRAFFISPLSAPSASDEQQSANVTNITIEPVDINSYGIDNLESYAQAGRGVWIEAVAPSFNATQNTRYVDFYVRACWPPPYDGPDATLGTVVRQYYTVGDDTNDYGGSLTPAPAPSSSIELDGSDYASCTPLAAAPCQDIGSSVTSCDNYRAQYVAPSPLDSGDYILEIDYSDTQCNGSSAPNPPAAYKYNITVKAGGRTTNYQLPSNQTSASINLGTLSGSAPIEIEWTNNCWINSDGSCWSAGSGLPRPYADPDFTINSIKLSR